MKISVLEDNSRKIGSREHNRHVANGIEAHKPTQIAPPSLYKPLDPGEKQRFLNRVTYVENIMLQHIGTPYYSNNGFILYNTDCANSMELLCHSEINIELTLTSPPYNIGKEYEKSLTLLEYVDWCSKWMELIYRITSSTGSLWLNLGYLEVPEKGLCVPIPYLLWDKSPFYLIQEVVWAYGAGVSTKNRLSPRNEKWLFYVKNPNVYTFNLDEIRDPNVKYPNQRKNGKFRCNPLGKNPSDVWEFPKVTTGKDRSSQERTGHPAQFPLGVVERIIRAASNTAEIVLDPFAGSCSTGIASIGLGRIFIGFEIRSDYCDAAIQRFELFLSEQKKTQMQTSFF